MATITQLEDGTWKLEGATKRAVIYKYAIPFKAPIKEEMSYEEMDAVEDWLDDNVGQTPKAWSWRHITGEDLSRWCVFLNDERMAILFKLTWC